jgi:uncharacterized membrane protein YdjX (TVP38/TMEM64 family)
MKNCSTGKKVIILIWILFLISCVGIVLIYPQQFTPQNIAAFLLQFKTSMLFVYFLLSLARGLTLVPSTPLVIAGTILFPTELFWVLAISIAGIMFSSTMIYHFSDYLGFGAYLEHKQPRKISRLKHRLQQPTGFLFVFLWSVFPFLPTDAVCYVAGILKMNFTKFMAAMTFGELIICTIYIFFYAYLAGFLQTFVRVA